MATARMRHADAGAGAAPALAPLALFSLPRDVLESVFRCLVGWDLLRLASVSRAFHEELLADADRWAAQLPQPLHDWQRRERSRREAKKLYAAHRSFRFRGGTTDFLGQDRGACIEVQRFLPHSSKRDVQLFVPLAPRKFSIDVWFSLLECDKQSTKSGSCLGGILLGAQSAQWQDTMVWPDFHQQFIHVDSELNLYGSVVGDKSVVVKELKLRQWYHFALVFDNYHERVYLDGKLVRRVPGGLHRDWRSLYYMQVGTGCISAGSSGAPSSRFTGWYAFNGMLDELRVWEDPLDEADIVALAQYKEITKKPAGSTLKSNEPATHLGGVELVRCSWPRERTCIASA